MSPPVIDPADLIRTRPPGGCLWTRWMIPPTFTWQMGWLMREESAKIVALGDAPEVEWRAGAQVEHVGRQPVLVVAFVGRIGLYRPEHLWESWLNPCAEGNREALADLAQQEEIVTHWYGDLGERERSLASPNWLREFAASTLLTLNTFPQGPWRWSMRQFDAARARWEQRYPSIEALWHGLALPPGRRSAR